MKAMPKAALFLIDNFEETEALTTVDILRRGEVDVMTVSLTGNDMVMGKHGIPVRADVLFENVRDVPFDMLVIPGGTTDYTEHDGLLDLVRRSDKAGRELAAICAAPAVFGRAGILQDRRAVCYPGMESWLTGAQITGNIVETDGHITTSQGPATAMFFALRLLEILQGKEIAQKVSDAFLVPLIDARNEAHEA
ncbi:MAG: DJ-1/PfpI family protein [Synergistaceae bacterium]|jgi:4-methyl-5(b-hydroxyethyl)-thiazole monophosphate biosynthesis|nr:DJ-1/PfpI family protein [Synergistaceae bacterium]